MLTFDSKNVKTTIDEFNDPMDNGMFINGAHRTLSSVTMCIWYITHRGTGTVQGHRI